MRNLFQDALDAIQRVADADDSTVAREQLESLRDEIENMIEDLESTDDDDEF